MHRPLRIYRILLLSMFLTGWYLNSYGLLIPYYTLASGHDQTHFSFVFIVRSLAYISGSLTVKCLCKRVSTHCLFVAYAIATAIALYLCCRSIAFVNLGVTLFVSAFCIMSMNVLTYSLTVQLFHGKGPQFWILVLGVFSGLGATLSPLLTMWLKLDTYKAMAALTALIVPMLLLNPLPDVEEHNPSFEHRRRISKKTEIYICIILFVFPVQQIGFASWLPTYSIKAGISTVQHSSMYSLYFWLPNTLSRVVWAFFVMTPIKDRLSLITRILCVFGAALVGLQLLGKYEIICVAGPMAFGCMLGCFLSFCLALPLSMGFYSTTANNANMMLAYCIGQGALLAPNGYLMNIFGFQSLMVAIFASSCASAWTYSRTVGSLEEDRMRQNFSCSRNLLQYQLR